MLKKVKPSLRTQTNTTVNPEWSAISHRLKELEKRYDWRLPIVPGAYILSKSRGFRPGSTIVVELWESADWVMPPGSSAHLVLVGTMVREVK